MDKLLTVFDGNNSKDSCKLYDTDISIYTEGTDELLFRGKNKVIISGAGFTARSHFKLTGAEVTPTYNTKLTLENTDTGTPLEPARCCLFAVGTDGCGAENSQVYPVDYKKWIKPDSLVPFRYPATTNDIAANLRSIYYGRKVINDKVAYYFKAFDTEPVLVQQYVDGTAIDNTIYDNNKADEAETYVELRLKLTKEDCREFFIATSTINAAKVNTISLLTAWPKTYTGNIYYQDIRPLTKLNIPNEALIDLTKGLDIIYHIYY